MRVDVRLHVRLEVHTVVDGIHRSFQACGYVVVNTMTLDDATNGTYNVRPAARLSSHLNGRCFRTGMRIWTGGTASPGRSRPRTPLAPEIFCRSVTYREKEVFESSLRTRSIRGSWKLKYS